MNRLPREKQIQVINALVEGCSIRSCERMFDVHRDTVTRLMVRTGEHCMSIMDDVMRDIPAGTIQCDEIWCYVGKKDKQLKDRERHNPELGSQFIFIAMDADTKLVPSFRIGKREGPVAYGFMADLRERLVGCPQISTDGFGEYLNAVATAFDATPYNRNVDFAQLVKKIHARPRPVREGYSPGGVVSCRKYPIFGEPDHNKISTSLIERQNLTVRMSMRRLTRLTNGFSKKLDNLKAATSLHFANYNFCRIHATLRVTPAMAAGVADTIWDLERLIPHEAVMKYRDVLEILHKHGFKFDRQKGSHKTYKGMVGGKVQIVQLAFSQGSEDVNPDTLSSIKRQSGLPKKLFRS